MKVMIKKFFRSKKRLGFSIGSIGLAILLALNLVPVMPLVTVEALGYEIRVPSIFVTGEGHLSIESDVALAASIDSENSSSNSSGVYLQQSSNTSYGLVDYTVKEPLDMSQYAYVEIEPSGCGEFHGNVKIRYDFFLTPDAYRYDDRHLYVVDTTTEEYLAGYTGKFNEDGTPKNLVQYDKWDASLPRVWVNTPFHSHFCYFDADVTNAEVEKAGLYHLGNFYSAWCDDWTDVQGGMRHGWDTETRVRPVRYDEVEILADYELRKDDVETRVEEVKTLGISDSVGTLIGEGETFPSTDIDVGPAASDRAADLGGRYTWINLDNPANATGTLDTIEIWAWADLAGVKAGTFSGSGTSYDDRDYESIGNVTAGAKRTFTGKDCDVTTGDFIGAYWTTGRIEHDSDGFAGIRYKSGDQFGTGVQTYSLFSSRANSLYGTGETASATPTVTTQAVDDIDTTTATGNGNITDTGGENCTTRGIAYGTTSINVTGVKTASTIALEDTESFETNYGDWPNAAGNDEDWTRLSGATGSGSTGPSSAYDGSWYIYVETSSGHAYTLGDISIVEYDIGSSENGYVDFYYHQYGANQGALYLEGYNGSSWVEIWSSTGDQGNQWNHIEEADSAFTAYSKLRFRNVAAGGYAGDVALDIVKVYTGDAEVLYTIDDYDDYEESIGDYGAGAFDESLTGLTADTTYYARAYAENSAGASYGTEVEFDTLTACAEDIANTPATENLGTLATNTTYYANGSAPSNPVVDGECTFTITNSSGGAVDITIKATDFTGGNGWTLTSGAPGSDTTRMTAYYSGLNPASGVVLTTSYQAFITALADSGTKKWDFKLESPSAFTDGVSKSSTITVSATCA